LDLLCGGRLKRYFSKTEATNVMHDVLSHAKTQREIVFSAVLDSGCIQA